MMAHWSVITSAPNGFSDYRKIKRIYISNQQHFLAAFVLFMLSQWTTRTHTYTYAEKLSSSYEAPHQHQHPQLFP